MSKPTQQQIAQIVTMLANGDYDRKMAQAIVEKRIEVIEKPREQTGSPYRGGPPSSEPGFRLEVIYVQPSYADLKQAFDWVYDGYASAEFKPIDVCKDVPTDTREIEFELVHLNKDMSTDAILAQLDKRGLRPALYEELLAFAAKYPELQKQFPIVALGSVFRFDGGLFSPYVDWHDRERNLYFHWIDDDWLGFCRFLSVRK